MKLYLVRHGETEENALGIIQGHRPGRLTRLGHQQAGALAAYLAADRLDVIYCSDLDRAKETVSYIAAKHPAVPLHFDADIRERSLGVFEGLPREIYHERRTAAGESKAAFRPEGGESMRDLVSRSDRFMEKLRRNHSSDSSILLCSHGGTLTALLSGLLGRALDEMLNERFHNGSLSVVEIGENGSSTLLLFNSVAHLQALRSPAAGEAGDAAL